MKLQRWVIVATLAFPLGTFGQTDDGRALDANFQVGSNGYNEPYYQFVPTSGDLIITGNVTGGRAFQGFSPIEDPSAFRSSVPSATLSTFRRDSFGLSNLLPSYGGTYVAPYFDRSRTTTNPAALGVPFSEFYDQSTSVVPRLDLSARNQRHLPTDDERVAGPLEGLPVPLLISDPTQPALDETAFEGTSDPTGYRLKTIPRPSESQPQPYRGTYPSTFDYSQLNTTSADGSYESLALRSRLNVSPTLMTGQEEAEEAEGSQFDLDRAWSAAIESAFVRGYGEPAHVQSASPSEGVATGVRMGAGATGEIGGGALRTEELTSLTATGDPYTDFQAALNWIESRNALVDQRPTIDLPKETGPRAGTLEQAQDIVTRSVPSFAGKADTLAADYHREAEQALRKGNLQQAIAMYQLASKMDPNNPLIDLGKGHAYLVAGNYDQAVLSLLRGIERFPGMSWFRMDLSTFLDDPTLLDRRRADLESQLKRNEDYRKRFLLGYAEFYSGLEDFGRANLLRAAAEAPAESTIAKVPAILGLTEPMGSGE